MKALTIAVGRNTRSKSHFHFMIWLCLLYHDSLNRRGPLCCVPVPDAVDDGVNLDCIDDGIPGISKVTSSMGANCLDRRISAVISNLNKRFHERRHRPKADNGTTTVRTMDPGIAHGAATPPFNT